MSVLNYIIWNVDPEIFRFHLPWGDRTIALRWYGFFFALGFLISQQLLYLIYKKENKPERDVDILTLFMVVATIVGARLGHVLFYEPERYLKDPLEILAVWNGGLASHGAAIAILFALWLYARKKKPGQSYLQVVDRIVILVALTGALIRTGNFFNSEIIGKPTDTGSGVVFARSVTEYLEDYANAEDVAFVKVDSAYNENNYPPVKLLVDFNPEGSNPNELTERVRRMGQFEEVRKQIDFSSRFIPHTVQNDKNGYSTVLFMYMIPRHPAQLYEAILCLILFGWLWWIWSRYKDQLPPGRLLGIFLIYCFGFRFLLEFLKEPQVDFEENMRFNMGQLLSIPLVIAGIVILIYSYKKKEQSEPPEISEEKSV